MLKKLYLLLAIVTFASCQKTTEVPSGEGVVKVKLNTDSLTVVVSKSAPVAEDFRICIENTKGENLREWSSIAEVPSEVRMVAGSYRFVAWKGDNTVFPSWDQVYWQGEHKFKVDAGQVVEAPIVVKLGVAKVHVNFDASFTRHYSQYSADVRTTTPSTPDAGFLNFTPVQDADQAVQEGNFLPGTLRLRLRLTSLADGKEYLFSPPVPVGKASAAELHTINLKVDQTTGLATLVVDVDGEVTLIEITKDLPASTLPKAAPRINSVGFDYTQGGLTLAQGNMPTEKMAASINAPGGIKSVKIVPKSIAMSEAMGGLSEIDLVGAMPEQRILLEQVGFSWSNVLNDALSASKAVARVEVRFDEMFAKLFCKAQDVADGSVYAFEIQVIDMFLQTNISTSQFVVANKITPPQFTLSTPTDGNVWAKTAEFQVDYTSNVEGAVPYIEIQKSGETTWSRAQQSYKDLSQGVRYITVSELTPATQYAFRATFGTAQAAHSSDPYTFTTEAEQVLQNGDMESWKAWQLGTSAHNVPYYQPWTDEQAGYWTTNNDRTTSYRTKGVLGTTYGYNCFPAVSYTLSANSGKYSAEIRTTSASNIDGLNTTTIAQKHSTVAGLLYIGDFSYTKPNDNVTLGKPHTSRPSAFSFFYTYSNYNGDSFDARIILYNGATQIGFGSFVSKPGEGESSYTKVEVSVLYSNRLLRADKMTIIFRSTTKDQAEVRKITMDLDYEADMSYNKGWSVHVGSVLRVDDVNLVY